MITCYTGNAYRGITLKWAHLPYSGEGAKLEGRRYNPIGAHALYCSITHQTMLKEITQGVFVNLEPTVIVNFQVNKSRILDLRKPSIRTALGISVADMNYAWSLTDFDRFHLDKSSKSDLDYLAPSQLIFFKTLAAGADGIISPSYAIGAESSEANIVFFDWNRGTGTEIEVHDPKGMLPGYNNDGLPTYNRNEILTKFGF